MPQLLTKMFNKTIFEIRALIQFTILGNKVENSLFSFIIK